LKNRKLHCLTGRTDSVYFGSINYGPTFGGGHDFVLHEPPFTSTNSYFSSGSYYMPFGINLNSFMDGASNFQVSELEVYETISIKP